VSENVLIETPEALREAAAALASAEAIALDVEGDGLFKYRSRMCTVQMASRDRVAIVDTLAFDARAALGPLLAETGPLKVIHDAAFDARLLRENGIALGRVFDTAVAARFLGEKSTGLAALLKARFGIDLQKEQQQADWGKRPLGADALVYLVDDVRYLLDLAERLREEIRAKGIEAEVEEECRYVLSRAAEEPPEALPAWVRISGSLELPAAQQALLREVAEVREAAARRLDVPPFKVIGNDVLIAVAKRRPRTPADLAKIPGGAAGRARAIGGDLLAAVRRAESLTAPPEEDLARVRRPSIPHDERQRRKEREQRLSAWRKETAKARGVDPQVVLPGHCLSDLGARGAASLDELRAIPGLGEVRVQRDGEVLLRVLSPPAAPAAPAEG
jgi:ribonuclease D